MDTIRERDLALRPLSSPEDVLRVMPGLVIAQHAGGGKADQLFLRGYFADQGDFGTAGSINFVTRDRFEAPFVQVEAGDFGTRRILAAGSPPIGGFSSVLAAEAYLTDGP